MTVSSIIERPRRVLRRVQHVEAQPESRGQRDEVAEAQRELADAA